MFGGVASRAQGTKSGLQRHRLRESWVVQHGCESRPRSVSISDACMSLTHCPWNFVRILLLATKCTKSSFRRFLLLPGESHPLSCRRRRIHSLKVRPHAGSFHLCTDHRACVQLRLQDNAAESAAVRLHCVLSRRKRSTLHVQRSVNRCLSFPSFSAKASRFNSLTFPRLSPCGSLPGVAAFHTGHQHASARIRRPHRSAAAPMFLVVSSSNSSHPLCLRSDDVHSVAPPQMSEVLLLAGQIGLIPSTLALVPQPQQLRQSVLNTQRVLESLEYVPAAAQHSTVILLASLS